MAWRRACCMLGANEISQHIFCHNEEGLWLRKSIECGCWGCTVSTHFCMEMTNVHIGTLLDLQSINGMNWLIGYLWMGTDSVTHIIKLKECTFEVEPISNAELWECNTFEYCVIRTASWSMQLASVVRTTVFLHEQKHVGGDTKDSYYTTQLRMLTNRSPLIRTAERCQSHKKCRIADRSYTLHHSSSSRSPGGSKIYSRWLSGYMCSIYTWLKGIPCL